MPDLQDYSITPAGNEGNGVPRFTISCRITDSQTGQQLADFTKTRTIAFPAVLAKLTPEQKREIVEIIAQKLIFWEAGLG